MITSRSQSGITLSAQDLLAISEDISQNFARSLETLHLETSSNNNVEPAQVHSSPHSDTQLSRAELLVIEHNINFNFVPEPLPLKAELVLLVVDPYHLHAYWQLTPANTATFPLVLRVYWRPIAQLPCNTALSFDSLLSPQQSSQTLHVPVAGTAYSAVVGYLHPNNHLDVLAESAVVQMPADHQQMPALATIAQLFKATPTSSKLDSEKSLTKTTLSWDIYYLQGDASNQSKLLTAEQFFLDKLKSMVDHSNTQPPVALHAIKTASGRGK